MKSCFICDFIIYVVFVQGVIGVGVKLAGMQRCTCCSSRWPHILETLEEKLQRRNWIKYKTLDKKLENLSQTQTLKPQKKLTFHPRAVNNTDISFSISKMSMLQRGPKYNIHAKKKN